MILSFLKYLEYEKRYSPHTLSAYNRDLNQVESFLQRTFEIADLTTTTHQHLRSWVIHLIENGTSSKTANRKIATLKSFFKYLLLRGFVAENPASRLKPLKVEKKLPNFVRETEITSLLDEVEYSKDFVGFRDRLLLELLYGTGIRLSELIKLRNIDVNLYQQNIKVFGKRNKERLIPLTSSIVEVIKEYMKIRDANNLKSGFLLVTESGEKLYPMLVYRIVKKYLTLVTTVTQKSPHVLRHTFATHLLNRGADLNAVKDLLGHTSLAATQVYTHNTMEKLKAVFDQAHPKA